MDSTNEKLSFQIENKKTGNVIYQHEIELAKFQKDTIENEDVSFFYTFKDMRIELEENIASKLKLNENKNEISFIVKYSDKILYDSVIDVKGIDEKAVSDNEMQLYFIFEKVSKIIINKIAEVHKDIVLSNIEKVQHD